MPTPPSAAPAANAAKPACRLCEMFPRPPRTWLVAAVQAVRKLIKSTFWTPLTLALDRVGLGLQSIQVLCIDRSADRGAGRVLVLLSEEIEGGFCPVQGLRKCWPVIPRWFCPDTDARADAYAELLEEATPRPPPLERFRLVRRYREGTWHGRYTGQFACSVFVIDCTMDEIPLRGEGGEGIACWARLDEAVEWLDNPILTPILTGEPVLIGDFERPGANPGPDLCEVQT
jgi:hypothetical protein